MKLRALGITLILVSITLTVFGQTNVEWKKENFPGKEDEFDKYYKIYQEADKMYYNVGPPAYEGALVKYLEAYDFNPDNDQLNFHIGHVYFALHHPHEAEPYYEKAIILNPELKDEILYELAVSYHQDGDWDNAIEHYKMYKDWLKNGHHRHLVMHENDIKHELKYADLCIKQCETGKVLTHDTIPIIYENLGSHINSKYPEYSPVVNHDEDLLIFVSTRPESTGDNQSHGTAFDYEDVYYSRRDENGWSDAKHLHGDVNSHAHEAPVWVSGDGTRLLLYYNKSKKKASKQGDIYESDFVDGAWTDPKPLKMVNSGHRETHASISADGNTIYFTTNNPKWAKHGGMDIVKTTYNKETGKWSEPVDVGGTINTEWDEESPFIKPDNKHFYFSSQGHTSIGGFDFFKCEINEDGSFSEPINMGFPLNTPFDDAFIYMSDDGQRVFFNSNRVGGFGSNDIYEGFILSEIDLPVLVSVYDKETNLPITDAEVSLVMAGDPPTDILVTNKDSGHYSAVVGVMKHFTGNIEANDYIPQKYSFATVYEKLTNFDTTVIRKTVYLQKDYSPVVFSGQLFDKVTGNPVDGLIEVMLGDEKVAEIRTTDSKFSMELPRNKNYTITALAKGHMPYRETFKLTAKDNKRDYQLDRIKVGDRFAMRNIQYEFGSAKLTPESKDELGILKEFMLENPYIKVEISAHTDSIGSRKFNLKLSIARAKSIYNWLIKNGISKSKITYKGYGPDKPIATNSTDEGRALNRRAELKILEDH